MRRTNVIYINTRFRRHPIMGGMEGNGHTGLGMIGVAKPVRGLLRDLPVFEGLRATALERIAAGVSDVCARGRTVIFRRGDACRGLYIVISGQVKLALDAPQGGEQVVELVGPGGTLDETALILGVPHVLTATALADCRLLHMARASVLSELDRTPEFMRRILTNLSHRLQQVIGALEDCTLRSGTERVIGYLLNQLPSAAVGGQVMVRFPAKKGVIAAQLNLTHEHFSRILRGLATAAMIEVDGPTVRIRDVGQLRAYGSEG